ncbi:MAG TPA: hypothetical protein VFX59_19810 [Polyangiales bacterium]|nr:hypothetical protein [Polyangiales bacterium]
MYATRALRIEVRRGDQVEVLEVQEEGAMIGSGSHCDVRLAPDEAAVEQMYVEIVGDDVFARVKAIKPACRVNGAPFLEGKIAPSALIEVGVVAIRASVVGRRDGTSPAKGESKATTSPAVQALGVVAIALGLYAVLNNENNKGIALAAINPPGVRTLSAQICPQKEAQAARALAEQLRTEAGIKRERAPFHPGDALDGAPLYERAAGCFATAGDSEASEQAHHDALELQQQVADQVRLAHVRIERSLEQKNYENARRNAEFALALVPESDDKYAQWLLSVKRASTLQEKGKKK